VKKISLLCFMILSSWLAAAAGGDGWASYVPVMELKDREEAPGPASMHAEIVNKLKQEIPGLLDKYKVPGFAIAVVKGSGTIWSQGYGYTDKTKKYPVNDKTLFALMSVSKGITSLGLMLAVQDGLLDMDAPISRYLPDYRINSLFSKTPETEITLRHLLAHRSGLENDVWREELSLRPHEIEEYVGNISDSWMSFPVGYRDYYSNTGMDLAGYMVERKTKIPFREYMKKRVFEPLGMNDSTFDLKPLEAKKDRALGHWADEADQDKRPPFYIPMIACGGCYSTIVDMARYLQFHINQGRINGKQLIREDLIRHMHEIAYLQKGQRSGFSLGMEIEPIQDTYCLRQDGGGFGFQSAVLIYPDYDFGIAILANSCWTRLSGNAISRMVREIATARFGEKEFDKTLLSTEGLEKVSPDSPLVKKVLGFYDVEYKMYTKDNECFLDMDGETYPVTLYSKKGRLLGRLGSASEITFLPDLLGTPGNMAFANLKYGTVDCYAYNKPLPENDIAGPDKPEWKKYLGQYQLLQGDVVRAQFNVEIENGYLTVNGSRCRELRPGLFFNADGNAFDFRKEIPTGATFPLKKIRSTK
jgi:CubicO group peptidase (beta-lactamase class C family)